MKDIEIIDLFFKRDEGAISATDEKYGRLCHRIAYNILNNEGEAEECKNDTYLSLWKSIPPTKPNNFKAFVAKVARNLSLKRFEYNSAQKRASNFAVSLSELEEFLPDEHFSFEIEDEQLGDLINSFLNGEKNDARRAFIKRYFFGDDIKSIAKDLGFSESKVKSLLFNTRHRLKEFLVQKGVYL